MVISRKELLASRDEHGPSMSNLIKRQEKLVDTSNNRKELHARIDVLLFWELDQSR
jgi:hypothetical protein